METRAREVIRYVTPDEVDVFGEWYDGLTDKLTKLTIFKRIERVKMGNLGDCKPVGEGVSELRFISGIRIYYAEIDRVIILLLCGGDKSSQVKDILKAQEYLKELKARPEV